MTTAHIASWTSSLTHDDIPSTAVDAAIRSLYNYLGCAIYGSSHPTVSRASSALQSFFGQPTTVQYGTANRFDAQHGALLNGIASHVHDYDDTHLATVIHPTSPVASAVLAYTQHHSATTGTQIDGSSLLRALVAGIEVECKLGMAVYPRHYNIGWHITSTTGAIGAAIAVARLMGLSEQQILNAVGIAATQVSGLRCNFGSDTKPFHAGRAAQNGLLAALLAQQGFTSDNESVEAKRGWANAVTGGLDHNSDVHLQRQLDKHIGDLGQTWEVSNNTFKPFPCGIVAHPAIDAAIQLRQKILDEVGGEHDLLNRLQTVTISLRVHPLVVELTNKQTPKTGLEAKFSVYHAVAVGLVYGKAGPAEYEDEIVRSEDVVKVRDSVSVQADNTIRSDETVLEAFGPKSTETPIHSIHVEHTVGSLDVPMTNEQLTRKFLDQVIVSVGKEKAQEISSLCWSLGETHDVSGVLDRIGELCQ